MNLHNTEKTSPQECSNVTILFPGKFKPLTGAHIDLIHKYVLNENIKKIILFISPQEKDGVSAFKVKKIASKLFENLPVEIILDKKSYSPILAIYRWIENKERESGFYSLAASTKDNDNNRISEFVRNYQNEKYKENLPTGVKVIDFQINNSPLLFQDSEQPISATIARKALNDNNFDMFKYCYPNLEDKDINYIWNTLKE